MASSSQSSNFVINFHRGGSFVRNPLTYDFEILVKVKNVDLSSMDYDALGRLILSEFSSEVKSMFYLLPGKDLDSGLSSMFELNEADGSDSDLEDDLFDYFSEDNSDTTFVDHLYDGKEEVFEIRTQKTAPKPRQKPSKMFDITFLTRIYSALDMEEYVDTDVRPLEENHDIVGDQFPIHDPSIKWKLIKPVLGERYESPDQLKRALAFYALANGYKLYYEVNNPRKLHAKCSKDSGERKWSTCKLGVDNMPDGKNYFKTFYVCFTGVTQGWLQGCMRVIGLDGCFLKTICKGELLSVVGGDGNNQIYPIAWAVIDVENKENWSWFMKCLIDDLEHKQCVRHIYANFRKRFNGVVYKNLFWKATKATYPAKFEMIMSEMKSVSIDAHNECFNALIVEARRKPIIDMLEGIRLMIMERMRKMREKHVKGDDGIYPNIKKNTYAMISIGIRKWYQVEKVKLRSEMDPENYIFDWYGKHLFVATYATYIEGMNGMDQWPTTEYTKPLPLIVRKIPRRPPHKKRDGGEKDDGNRTDGEGYENGQTKSVRGGKTARGGSSVRGGKTARGGNASGSASGSQSVRGGIASGSPGGSHGVRTIGGVRIKGGVRTRGGASSSASGSAQGYASGEGSACGGGRDRGWSAPATLKC
ncbi:(R)-mandelonitrile lyase-like protein [Tanacetum coccineum]